MNNSLEEFWKEQARTRRKILGWFLLITIILFSLISGLCYWITQPLFFTPENTGNGVTVDPEFLRAHVEKLSKEFAPRSAGDINNLNKSADYIKENFEKFNGRVSEQQYQVNGKLYRNIIVAFGEETNEKIIVGAHYDAAGEKPAADDNASGIAGLIELSKLLAGKDLPMTVELVAYTLEEPPYFGTEQMGSYIHAKSLNDSGSRVRLMISFEMIGYFSDDPNSQKFPVSFLSLLYPNKGNYVAIVGNLTNVSATRSLKSAMSGTSDLPIYSANTPSFINGVDFSDHRNYWKFGYNAVMITDTAFYRNFNYHTSQDTAEKLDYNRMSKVVEGVYQAVVEMAK